MTDNAIGMAFQPQSLDDRSVAPSAPSSAAPVKPRMLAQPTVPVL